MTPEEHRDAAILYYEAQLPNTQTAIYHATMGILEALLQMEICGHGTRGFCKDCFIAYLRDSQPWAVRNSNDR